MEIIALRLRDTIEVRDIVEIPASLASIIKMEIESETLLVSDSPFVCFLHSDYGVQKDANSNIRIKSRYMTPDMVQRGAFL